MALFGPHPRVSADPKTAGESEYEFLNRSNWPAAARIRQFVNDWANQYPKDHRKDLEARIKDRRLHNSSSAFFELLLFAHCRSAGYEVTVHPHIAVAKRPDFLLRHPDGDEFYLEATCASDLSHKEQAGKDRLDAMLEIIASVRSYSFYVAITTNGYPERVPRAKPLRDKLTEWLATLDPDVIAHAYVDPTVPLPVLSFSHEGVTAECKPIPKKPDARLRLTSVLGIQSEGVCLSQLNEVIRSAVRSKATKYGLVDKPLLIAVNVDAVLPDRIDEQEALFGDEVCVINPASTPPSGRMQRHANGAWLGRNGPINSRVSGVWVFSAMSCWTAGATAHQPTLYLNPWARQPLPAHCHQLSHAKVEEGRLTYVEGLTFRDVLGVPTGWPIT